MKQACNTSPVSNIHSAIILSNPHELLVSCKPSMVGKYMGLVQLCKHIEMQLYFFIYHCMVHQQAYAEWF